MKKLNIRILLIIILIAIFALIILLFKYMSNKSREADYQIISTISHISLANYESAEGLTFSCADSSGLNELELILKEMVKNATIQPKTNSWVGDSLILTLSDGRIITFNIQATYHGNNASISDALYYFRNFRMYSTKLDDWINRRLALLKTFKSEGVKWSIEVSVAKNRRILSKIRTRTEQDRLCRGAVSRHENGAERFDRQGTVTQHASALPQAGASCLESVPLPS